MPRIRTIKPEICSDEKLASVSRESRLTFVLSITQADDDGLLAGNTRQLLAALYPLDDGVTPSMVELWRRELVQAGLWTQRYTLQGSSVVQITNWDRHQRIDKKGKSIILPTLAEHSRESRESVASVSRSDPHTPVPTTPVPTTVDRGAKKKDAAPSIAYHARLTDDFANPDHQAAYLRAATGPAFDGVLRSLHDPITGGRGVPWDIIGQALLECEANAVKPTVGAIRSYVRRLVRNEAEDARPVLTVHGLPASAREQRNAAAIAAFMQGEGTNGLD